MARIVLNTFGSFGDLHPYLALAIELKNRGHVPVLATSAVYQSKVEHEGIDFAAVRPDVGPLFNDQHFLTRAWDSRSGSESLLKFLIPTVHESFDDLLPACRNADLLLTHTVAFAGPLVAEKLGLRWLSVVLAPSTFFSAYDLPILGAIPFADRLRRAGPPLTRWLIAAGEWRSRSWFKPVATLRRELGLAKGKHPLFTEQYSPFGTLALFSEHFGQAQPDWPAQVKITGFIFYDQLGRMPGIRPDEQVQLLRFLDRGEPPILFTLGTAAVMHPGQFYVESLKACQTGGYRAILLCGLNREFLPPSLPANIHVASYAPYSEVMPRCALIVHQGGIGTTAQALRSGKPAIVVPQSHDQPDNGARIERLHTGRVIRKADYQARHVNHAIHGILQDSTYSAAARVLGKEITAENGVAAACDEIERVLGKS